jgi:MFS family permease
MSFSNKLLIPIITASSVGTIIEWYDFYIFGSLASIIATKFFPQGDPAIAFLATLSTYAAGFLVRPFGALFFGRLGDLIGRKYTFMVTLLLMGGSTFAIGLIPEYKTIGFFAPVIVLILRLLQGLAIGGEYGGAATFVAEHSPAKQRGFWTSWIQVTANIAFFISLVIIQSFKNILSPNDWEDWGWRLPFLISIFMVVISVYIRKNMKESPLFAHAKAEGKTSVNPLKESFGNKANLKVVLLALFGVTMGVGVVNGPIFFFVQTFLLKTLFLDYSQVNTIFIIGVLIGLPTNIIFGSLSDKIGRKPLLLLSLFLALIFFRPIYEQMYQTANLKNKTEDISQISIEKKQEGLHTITTTRHFYTDKTIFQEVEKLTTVQDQSSKTEFVKTIFINDTDKWKLIFLVWLLLVIAGISYGPLAAYLVEMFPLKIRYTSLSFPYHIGFGILGGMTLVIGTYLVNKGTEAHDAKYYLAGLNYHMVLMTISLVIGLFYLKENYAEQAGVKTSSKYKNRIKRGLGIVWMLLGLATAYFGILELGLPKIYSGKQDDLIFGIIMLAIITPIISGGLLLFGKYAWQGEYDD